MGAIALIDWPNDRRNSARFFEYLTQMIKRFGLPGTIIVGLGPGSYAGIRIAISAAIGLVADGAAELLGYPSVCAIDGGIDAYAVVGDARRHSFFFASVSGGNLSGDFELVNAVELQTRIAALPHRVRVFSSDALRQLEPRVEQRYPSAEILARVATEPGKAFVLPPLQPIYLREPNITVPYPVSAPPKL